MPVVRTDGRSFGVRSRDNQIFWDRWIYLAMGLRPRARFARTWSSANNYHVSEAQKEVKKKYVNNGYAFILSNDYDKISKNIHEYMKGIRVPSKYCIKQFLNKDTLKMHYKIIHRIEK